LPILALPAKDNGHIHRLLSLVMS